MRTGIQESSGISSGEKIFFLSSLALLAVAFVLGWLKLRYGFNFIDEGYHMTESWRLAAGDRLFEDGISDTLLLYTLFNALIFKMWPGITLLGFRELQFCFTALALGLFSAALYSSYRKYWFIPLVFSMFAFTGLDPMGMISNLNYYTYPHFFLVVYVSFLIFGLFNEASARKAVFFGLAGFCLWCSSLSALYLGALVITPILLFVVARYGGLGLKYDFRDLCFTLAPFTVLWLVFLVANGMDYPASLLANSKLMVEHHWNLKNFNWEALKHTVVVGVFLGGVIVSLKKLNTFNFVLAASVLAAGMFLVISTSFFGLITPYYSGWFSKPMWLASALVCVILVYWVLFSKKVSRKEEFSLEERLCLVLMLPSTIQFLVSSIVSTNGVMEVLHCAIPLTAASVLLVLSLVENEEGAGTKKFVVVSLLFLPFYATTAWSDWNYTYFDVIPRETDARISRGFGDGIYTNSETRDLYNWISRMSSTYSKENDYIISYIISPMAYMIAHRRPALDHTFTDFLSRPAEFYRNSVEKMVEKKRNPKLAFVFECYPAVLSLCFVPEENRAGLPAGARHMWLGRQFNFAPSTDPISTYVKSNMYLLDKHDVTDQVTVMCFVDNPVDPAILQYSRASEQDPRNPELFDKLGSLYMQKSDYKSAVQAFRKALSLDPSSLKALGKVARAFAAAGKYEESIGAFRKIVEIKPDDVDSYYNLACVLSREKKDEEALLAFRKAVELGFSDCRMMLEDKDLERIRGAAVFREIVRMKCPN